MTELVLAGINGGNPLGFLAALGTALLTRETHPDLKLSWRIEGGIWQPILHGCETDRTQFIEMLIGVLKNVSTTPFEIERRLPYSVAIFTSQIKEAQAQATPENRRLVDFLSAYGTEIHHDKGVFEDSFLRMVRSGDSSGQGLPAYALGIHRAVDADALQRTLFEIWRYQDDGPILRWDPVEDQRYALLWNDPQEKGKKQVKSMLGANALALEALVLFPVMPRRSAAATTGFHHSEKREYFTWPIWDQAIEIDVVKSLVSLPELHRDRPNREELAACGIVEIYRCERIAPSKYYKNFSPALPA